jgi:hypothetical protein
LYLATGETTQVKGYWVEKLEQSIQVYNFEVADWHTYYVSEYDVLVHNSCQGPGNIAQDGTSKVRFAGSTEQLQNARTVRTQGTGLVNGSKMRANAALDKAERFLGPGYLEKESGRFVSANGRRQVRFKNSDLNPVNNHAGAPHMNFETLIPNPKKPGKLMPDPKRNIHIYIIDY